MIHHDEEKGELTLELSEDSETIKRNKNTIVMQAVEIVDKVIKMKAQETGTPEDPYIMMMVTPSTAELMGPSAIPPPMSLGTSSP